MNLAARPGPRRIRTASIATLGCKLNQAESYRVQIELARAGVDLVPFGEPADLTIVNTCTVTHVADQQGRQLLRRSARLSPGSHIVAMGCYAQVAPEEVRAIAGVDLVVTERKEQLVQLLREQGLVLGEEDFDVEGPSGPDALVPLPASRIRHFVKIQDGCDDYCTYCIVPFARGHSTSRPADEVVDEVKWLVDHGCREVVLTGVQIGGYGRDRYFMTGQQLPAPGAPLAALVRRLLDETEVGRVRISSIQPQDWAGDFLDLFADPRMCRHLHLPLQSGCDATLRRMSRRYTTGEFAHLVEKVRDRMPDIALTADMIAGFPGESEADHEESVAFATEMQFADVHVFRYSPRRGTAASRMAGHIPPEVKKRRSDELRKAAAVMGVAYRARFLGERREVLWEEEVPHDKADASRRWTGLTDNYLRVEVVSDRDLLGETSWVILGRLNGSVFEARVEEGATSRGHAWS